MPGNEDGWQAGSLFSELPKGSKGLTQESRGPQQRCPPWTLLSLLTSDVEEEESSPGLGQESVQVGGPAAGIDTPCITKAWGPGKVEATLLVKGSCFWRPEVPLTRAPWGHFAGETAPSESSITSLPRHPQGPHCAPAWACLAHPEVGVVDAISA